MMYRSRVRRMILLNPRVINGRPIEGSLMTSSGMRWWSLNGATEELRKNQSDLNPIQMWPAMREDWEVVK